MQRDRASLCYVWHIQWDVGDWFVTENVLTSELMLVDDRIPALLLASLTSQ